MYRGVDKINTTIEIPRITGNENCLESLRIAGSIHKMIRKEFQPMLKPGLDLINLSQFINRRTREYIKKYSSSIQYNDGIGFPPVPSMSNIIAHYSPHKISKILGYDDNLKIDFGVHVNGWIVDSSSTIYFNPEYSILHTATKEALDSALKIVGIDTPINEVSRIISEIIESYEIMYRGNYHTLKVIDGCSGHNITQYNIHGGILVPNKPSLSNRRFTKGVYAIEPFASILSSKCMEGPERNNYCIKKKYQNNSNPLYKYFNSMIFTDSHLEHYNINNINRSMLDIYPALYGIDNDMSCQYEHTIYLDSNTKEIISKFDDY
jgi:methionyl aminopeptidase